MAQAIRRSNIRVIQQRRRTLPEIAQTVVHTIGMIATMGIGILALVALIAAFSVMRDAPSVDATDHRVSAGEAIRGRVQYINEAIDAQTR